MKSISRTLNEYLITEKKEQERRLEICGDCEYNKGFCKKCGCIIRLKVKVKQTKCPINKWGPYDEKWGKKDEE